MLYEGSLGFPAQTLLNHFFSGVLVPFQVAHGEAIRNTFCSSIPNLPGVSIIPLPLTLHPSLGEGADKQSTYKHLNYLPFPFSSSSDPNMPSLTGGQDTYPYLFQTNPCSRLLRTWFWEATSLPSAMSSLPQITKWCSGYRRTSWYKGIQLGASISTSKYPPSRLDMYGN